MATDTDVPGVTETSVRTDLLQTLEIVTEVVVDLVREQLGGLAGDDVALPVEEPGGDFVLEGEL